MFVGVLFDLLMIVIFLLSLDVGYKVLINVGCIILLYKCCVEQVGFMVLKLLDILLILVEIGFILNVNELCKLVSVSYQQVLVCLIISGICQYFQQSLLFGIYIVFLCVQGKFFMGLCEYVVWFGEILVMIVQCYEVSMVVLCSSNSLFSDNLKVGQVLFILSIVLVVQ